jgi:tRNA 2-selenouridine synthase
MVKGGYKAFRQFFINQSEQLIDSTPLLLVGGKTGSGKTELLWQLKDIVDLEGIANHRGSAFGKLPSGQPSQIDFENQLSKRLLQLQQQQIKSFILEDESRTIGRCALPHNLRPKMQLSPVYWLEEAFELRVQRILNDYVIGMYQRYNDQYPPQQAYELYIQYLTDAFSGIKRRLGHERHQELVEHLQQALNQQQSQNNFEGHRIWIARLLGEYYDPIYDHQLEKKKERIVFRGNCEELFGQLQQQLEVA